MSGRDGGASTIKASLFVFPSLHVPDSVWLFCTYVTACRCCARGEARGPSGLKMSFDMCDKHLSRSLCAAVGFQACDCCRSPLRADALQDPSQRRRAVCKCDLQLRWTSSHSSGQFVQFWSDSVNTLRTLEGTTVPNGGFCSLSWILTPLQGHRSRGPEDQMSLFCFKTICRFTYKHYWGFWSSSL